MSNVSELLNHINRVGGLARSNRFRVTISLPELVLVNLGERGISLGERTVSIMCQSVSGTGVNIGFHDFNNIGTASRKMPYNRHSNSDLEMIFLCSEGLLEQTIFEAWANVVVGKNYVVEFFDNYVSDITVEHLDIADNVTKTVTYLECYPFVVGVINEDKTSTDSPITLTVTFASTKKSNEATDTAERSLGKVEGLKFGTKAKSFQSSSLNLSDAAPGYLLISPYTSDIVRRVDAIKKEVIKNSMSPQMAGFLFRNLLVSVARMEGVPTQYQEGIQLYINNVIKTLNTK